MESKPPLVSVIIPFFNATDWLEETIRSVLAQDFRDFEIALVDDGSTDESTTIARYFSDRYSNILYVEHERHANQGVACSRNLGIGKTRGEYIATLDADDYWEPNKLAEQIAMMEAHPELGMVCGAVRYWSSWAGGKDRIVQSGHVQTSSGYATGGIPCCLPARAS